MGEGFFSRGFRGRRRRQDTTLPPGQYLVDGFPVLSTGSTPHTPLEEWDFSIVGEVDEPKKWTWEEFRALPSEEITRDIYCVTKWSKLGTRWEGASVDTLLGEVETVAEHLTSAHKGEEVRELIEARGCELLFLAPYSSPDLNAIERRSRRSRRCWAKRRPARKRR